MKRFAIGLVLVGAAAFLMWPIGDAFENQVTVYDALPEKGGMIALGKRVFKVFPESQTVIEWDPGANEIPYRLAKCAVRDRRNWRCEYQDGSGVLTMSDGTFTVEPQVGPIVHVGRLRWWSLTIHDYLK